ncbi:hypothetical protein VWZ88_12670 [Phaeobacter sp. JH20_36]|uniref:hypothetical protein n=1 Tax=unclassified Phaeobacter TaxID=2621772 RepID=UPI003A8844E5
MTETTTTELTKIPEKAQIPQYFGKEGGIEELVTLIETEVSAVHCDYSTDKGRKAARSLAAKVSRSKTLIDAVGKEMTEDWREKTKKVNDQRKVATSRLDELRDKIKAPADEFEAKEAERVKAHMLALDKFSLEALSSHDSSAELQAKIDLIEATEISSDWEEFEGDARQQKAAALDKYRDDLAIAQAREAQEAELEQLRAEKAERERKEAEEQAARQREQEEREAKDRAHEEAERARIAAEKRAEQEKADAEARHQQELKEAKDAADKAAAAERKRIEDEKRAAEEAEAQRKADADHRKAITAEIVASITKVQPRSYEHLIELMIDGKIPHVKVAV